MNLPKKVHMVGIGGIGMSALAQLYHTRGVAVSGSDRSASPVTELLKKKGITVTIGHAAENLPEDVDLLVYSDAVPEEDSERTAAHDRGISEQSYFEALGDVSRGEYTIAVAGSHGKTTTTAMLAKMLSDAGRNPTVVVGSLVKDFDSNFVPGTGELGSPFVVEACEYRDHMLKLAPHILVVTNLEWEHTDYFTTFEQLKQSFRTAVERLPADGALIVNLKSEVGAELADHAPCRVIDYSDVIPPKLALLGDFNVANAQAAIAAAKAFASSLDEDALYESVATFQGSWRRFEHKGAAPGGAAIYDDYAHHPTEIRVTLEAVRKKFPDTQIVVAFHPHLYTRTRDFMEQFTEAFTAADRVLIAPIFPAREAPIEGVTSAVLAEKITAAGTQAEPYESLEDIESALRTLDTPDTLILTMGAGDIYKIADALVK
ncbi:MAG: UDP-N-acetylmuramate--L-alanine ligase [Patescibacteria group bacterium UBA2163]